MSKKPRKVRTSKTVKTEPKTEEPKPAEETKLAVKQPEPVFTTEAILEKKPESRFLILPKPSFDFSAEAILTDLKKNTTKGELNITEYNIEICMPPDFLASAHYPITVTLNIQRK